MEDFSAQKFCTCSAASSTDLKKLAEHAEDAAGALIEKLKTHSVTMAAAESCTAGLVSAFLAGVPGASEVLWGSFVCYTKEAKVSMLGLDQNLLERHGLASRETAYSMAQNTLKKSGADIAAAVTGIAGPLGDGSCVPVGTVWIAVAVKSNKSAVREFHFKGSRNTVRLMAALNLFNEVYKFL